MCVPHNQEHTFFGDLHANENPSCVLHERTVHEGATLGTRYTPASTSNMQVTRVHTGKRVTHKFAHLSVPAPHGTYICGINHHSIGLFTCYDYYHAFYKQIQYF